MEDSKIREIIEKFNLKNDLTENPNIWIGHAKIGFRERPSIEETKKILSECFDEIIHEEESTPEELKKTLEQWKNYHPFQNIREQDQPMFVKRMHPKIAIAVIWPWQFKEGVASLMIYQGNFLE